MVGENHSVTSCSLARSDFYAVPCPDYFNDIHAYYYGRSEYTQIRPKNRNIRTRPTTTAYRVDI